MNEAGIADSEPGFSCQNQGTHLASADSSAAAHGVTVQEQGHELPKCLVPALRSVSKNEYGEHTNQIFQEVGESLREQLFLSVTLQLVSHLKLKISNKVSSRHSSSAWSFTYKPHHSHLVEFRNLSSSRPGLFEQ